MRRQTRLPLRTRLATALVATSLALSACDEVDGENAVDDTEEGDPNGKADAIGGGDDPTGIIPNANVLIHQLLPPGDIGRTQGVPRHTVPYPDTYWPMEAGGIAATWVESWGQPCDRLSSCSNPQPSPLEKFIGLTDPNNMHAALEWEHRVHGRGVPGVEAWFGHCPGWAAASMLHPPVLGPISVTRSGDQLYRCELGDPNCTRFEVGDVNAIAAEAYETAPSSFIGARCDTPPHAIPRDQNGRIIRDGTGCSGLNAGALVILVGNMLKLQGRPFAIDAQTYETTAEIWNQPVYAYTLHSVQALDLYRAEQLTEGRFAGNGIYDLNPDARGWAKVDLELHWVRETQMPNVYPMSGEESRSSTRMVAVVELDRNIQDPQARIVGGEYIDDPNVGADRLTVPPFAWVPNGMGSDAYGYDASGRPLGHNPFVRNHFAWQLLQLATQ